MWRNFIPTVGQITILKLVQSLSKSRYAVRRLCVVVCVYVIACVFVILCFCATSATLHCIVLYDGSGCFRIWCYGLRPCLCCCVFWYLCSSATAATLHCTVVRRFRVQQEGAPPDSAHRGFRLHCVAFAYFPLHSTISTFCMGAVKQGWYLNVFSLFLTDILGLELNLL